MWVMRLAGTGRGGHFRILVSVFLLATFNAAIHINIIVAYDHVRCTTRVSIVIVPDENMTENLE